MASPQVRTVQRPLSTVKARWVAPTINWGDVFSFTFLSAHVRINLIEE